jgi:hypothetical protein
MRNFCYVFECDVSLVRSRVLKTESEEKGVGETNALTNLLTVNKPRLKL